MDWKLRDTWEDNYHQAEAYFKAYGHLKVPTQLVTESGLWLNKWLSVQRRAYSEGMLGKEQLRRLEAIGMTWKSKGIEDWNTKYELAQQYWDPQIGAISLKEQALHW